MARCRRTGAATGGTVEYGVRQLANGARPRALQLLRRFVSNRGCEKHWVKAVAVRGSTEGGDRTEQSRVPAGVSWATGGPTRRSHREAPACRNRRVTASTFVSPPRGDWPPRRNLPASHRALGPRPPNTGKISFGEGGSAYRLRSVNISGSRKSTSGSRYRPRGDPILPQRGAITPPGSARWLCPPAAGRGQLPRDSRINGAC